MKRALKIKGEGKMKYKFEISVLTLTIVCLSLAGIASADSVRKTLYVDGNKVDTKKMILIK